MHVRFNRVYRDADPLRLRLVLALVGLLLLPPAEVGAEDLPSLGEVNTVVATGSGQRRVRLLEAAVFPLDRTPGPARQEAQFASEGDWILLTLQHIAEDPGFVGVFLGLRGSCADGAACLYYDISAGSGDPDEQAPPQADWLIMPAGEYVIGLHVPAGEVATATFQLRGVSGAAVINANAPTSAEVQVLKHVRMDGRFSGELSGSMLTDGHVVGGVHQLMSPSPELSTETHTRRCMSGPFRDFSRLCSVGWLWRELHVTRATSSYTAQAEGTDGTYALEWEVDSMGVVDQITEFLILLPFEKP